MVRMRILTTYIVLFGLIAVGCNDDDSDPLDPQGGPPPAEMIGTWTFQSVTVDGAAASLPDVLEWQPSAVAARLMVQANGAYVYEEVDANGGQLWFESGFVFVDGSEIDINVLLDGDGAVNETSTLTYMIIGNVLTLEEVHLGAINVFTLTM